MHRLCFAAQIAPALLICKALAAPSDSLSWVCAEDQEGEGPEINFPGNSSTAPVEDCGSSCSNVIGCYAFDAYTDGCTLFLSDDGSSFDGARVSVRRLSGGVSPTYGSQSRSRCNMRKDCGKVFDHGAVVMLRNMRSRDYLSAGKARSALHDSSSSEREQWRVELADSTGGIGSVTFSSLHNGGYLHVNFVDDSSEMHHLPIVIGNTSSSTGSEWHVTCVGNQEQTIVQLENLRSHRYLHVDRSHVDTGSPVIQHKGMMSEGTLWLVIPVPGLPRFPVAFTAVLCASFLVLAVLMFIKHRRRKPDAGAELVVGPSGLLERRDCGSGGQRTNTTATGGIIDAEKAMPGRASSVAPPDNPAESSLCFVCGEMISDFAVVPCGHRCGCRQCMDAMHSGPGSQWHNCPICLGPVASVVHVQDLPLIAAENQWRVAA